MIVKFRFFDVEAWSIYATLQTIVALVIFSLGFKVFDLSLLVLSTLIAMMQGKLLPRAIFAFFLSLAVWPERSLLRGTILTVMAALATGMIPYNNPIQKAVSSSRILKSLVAISIFIWFIVIIYLMSDALINRKCWHWSRCE